MEKYPFLLDVTQVTETFLEVMADIAPDGQLPVDFEDQIRAAALRAVDRGDLDEAGLTEQGLDRIREMFGIRQH